MNLSQFLKKVEEISNVCSEEQLKEFIREAARVLPEFQREDFLSRLKQISGENTRKNKIFPEQSMQEKYEALKIILEEIESEERVLHSDINEEYDDWYNSSVDEFLYEDSEGVMEDVLELRRFIHECVDKECFLYGAEIGEKLFFMQIYVESEYEDEMFSLCDLNLHNLLDFDIENVLFETLYCVYKVTPMEERAERMYDIMSNSQEREVSLEKFLQFCPEELEDQEEFLDYWIDELELRTGALAEKLFNEAVELKDDSDAAVNIAIKNVNIHPGLLEKLLEKGADSDSEKMMNIGLETIQKMDKKYQIRSKIALLTAEYAEKCKKNDIVEKCYLSAFESHSTPMNYLRFLLYCKEGEAWTEKISSEKKKKLREIYERFEISKDYYGYSKGLGELQENVPGRNDILTLEFLDGQFENVLNEGLNTEYALGWSGTFMKQGFTLFALYLYEGKSLPKGISKMLNNTCFNFAFTVEEYEKGGNRRNDFTKFSDDEAFYSCFLKWKAYTPMSENIRKKIIQRMEELIELRVDGIMTKNKRNYYGECASYIAALGEVKEALGEKNAKLRFMEGYRSKYPRRYAFRDELARFGWRNI